MAISRSHQHDAASMPGRDSAEAAPEREGSASAAEVAPGADGNVQLPDAAFISNGHFTRVGNDLILSEPGGEQVIVRGYFASDSPPDLLAPNGEQVLSSALVQSFLQSSAPGQYAQSVPVASAPPIGQVDELTGEAFAVRADGTRVQLTKGDAVHQGDIIETGADGSAIRMIFVDKTMFALGSDARLALDELAFNPETLSGSAQFSILKGVFIFSSGQIAKTDNTDMTVVTPVATIGIRGTEVAGRVDDQGQSQFTIIDGVIEVTTRAGSVMLDGQGETTQVTGSGAVPSVPFVLTPAEYGSAYSEVGGVASNYLNQGQPGQTTPSPTDGIAPDGQDRSETEQSDPASSESTAEQSSNTVLASTLAGEESTTSGAPEVPPTPSTFDETPLASTLPAETSEIPGASGGAATGGGSSENETSETVTPIPGIDLAANLTYGGTTTQPNGSSSPENGADADTSSPNNPFDIGNDGAPAGGDEGVQPASYQNDGNTADAGGAQDGAGPGGNSSSSGTGSSGGTPDFGGGESPFRTDGNGSDPFGDNPYVSDPFGSDVSEPDYGGSNSDDSGSNGNGSVNVVEDGDDEPVPVSVPPQNDASAAPDEADPHAIALTVSNATASQKYQDLTDSSVLPDSGPSSFVLVGGADLGIASVNDSAEIALSRDALGDVEVTLNTAWNSVKNLLAESDSSADITVTNFVHADVHFGDGGDSHVSIVDAKRGFVTTGDGDDTVEIDAKSNNDSWSKLFDVRTGAGDDTVVFDGAPNGLSELTFDGGDGVDTLKLLGPGNSFDLSSPALQIANMERVDISGSTDVTLTIGPNVIPQNGSGLNALVGTAQSLVVDGDAGDTIDLVGAGWDLNPVGTTDVDGESYSIYEHASGDRVVADAAITVV